jgi:hypothetical protein
MAEYFPNEGEQSPEAPGKWLGNPTAGAITPTLQPVAFRGLSDAARAGDDSGLEWNDWGNVFYQESPKATLSMEAGKQGGGEAPKETPKAPCWGCWLWKIVLLLLLAWAIDKISSDD